MIVKKSGGNIIGAVLTSAEKKAMNMEIQRQLAEYDLKNEIEIEAMILWVLQEEFGFGEKRCRRFYDRFSPVVKDLVKRYEMDDSDDVWLCTHMLKERGIDLEAWRKESKAE